MRRPSVLAVLIALGSLAIGIVHLKLYFDGYDDTDVGPSFLLNAVAAGAAAVVVIVWDHALAVLPAFVVANATLLAFGLSRTDSGIPIIDFTEVGWNPSPEAAIAVAVEVATAVLCVAALAFRPVPRG